MTEVTSRVAGERSSAYVLDLADVPPDGLALGGGKAVNLGVLLRAGLPVPPGRCVTTAAYARVAGPVLDDVLAQLAATGPGDRDALAGLAATARERVVAAPVPDDLAAAVRAAADGPVAVRSSATAEDLPWASFAGQQDTYLNMTGGDAVLDAVRRCWASLWTDRAVAYRAAQGVDHRAVRLAVVIQAMVPATVAGVMFTADPVTGRRGQVVIDASPGLGEAVVSGAVNPDHVVVDPGGTIVERRPGERTVLVRGLAGGGVETVPVDPADPGDGTLCLTDAQVLALADLGRRVEDHYGAPQDTEWALDGGGTFWLTQARPITTLYPLPPRRADESPGDLRVYLSVNVAQGVYGPFTPMGRAAIRIVGASGLRLLTGRPADPRTGPAVLAEAGQRVFIDVTGALRTRTGRDLLPRIFGVMEARSAQLMSRLVADRPELSLVQPSRRPALRRAALVALRHRVPVRFAGAVLSPAGARRRLDRELLAAEATLRAPAGASLEERLNHVERTLGTMVLPWFLRIAPVAGAGFVLLAAAGRLLRGRSRPGELPEVLRSLPHNVTTEMDLALWDLAGRLRADPSSARLVLETPAADLAADRSAWTPVLADELGAFLARYGRRTVAEIDLGVPRWSDDPAHVLGVLANYLRLDDVERAPDALFARGAAAAEASAGRLARRAGGVRGRAVRFALGRARALAGLRERPKFWLVTVLAAARADLAAVGAELAATGRLDDGGDVFFVTPDEIREGGELRGLVAGRREAYEAERRRRHVPRVLLSDGSEPEAEASEVDPGDGALTGTPASAGTVTGTARVVLDPVAAHLEPGEILVCPSTDPGWTPLFLTAGALVMEMGGANSHGAVVAREYGIPAVVGVRHATERIATGDEITVDGASGTVLPAGG